MADRWWGMIIVGAFVLGLLVHSAGRWLDRWLGEDEAQCCDQPVSNCSCRD